jgi:hypothetical protein
MDLWRTSAYARAMAPLRPIDFWLKLVDTLINERFSALLEEHGVSRHQWELMRLLSTGNATQQQLDEDLAPFLAASSTPTVDQLAELADSGWVDQHGDDYALSERGATAFERLSAAVNRANEAITQDVEAADFDTALRVLERMAVNLGWQDPAVV